MSRDPSSRSKKHIGEYPNRRSQSGVIESAYDAIDSQQQRITAPWLSRSAVTAMRRPRRAPPRSTPRKKAARRKNAPTGRAASAAAAATDPSSAPLACLRPSTHATFDMGEGRSLQKLLIQQQQGRAVVAGQTQALADESRFRLFLELL